MGSNFKKSWSFWGGRKRFDHKFNNSIDDDFEGPRIRLEDRFQSPVYQRNKFQTRSLRFNNQNIFHHPDYQCFNSSMNNELVNRRKAHSQWSKNIQKSLGFQTLRSPCHNTFRGQGSAYPNQEPRRPPLLRTPNTPKLYNSHDVPEKRSEPIYENVSALSNDRPALLPTPDSPDFMPLHFPEEEEMDMTPELPPRNVMQVGEGSQNVAAQVDHGNYKGGARFNRAFQGVCTSMKTFSQRFRRKTQRHYQLDSSPCTPRRTPAKNLYPFDLNTPKTPHSYNRGTKRLQGSARRQLVGKENYGIARTPNHFHSTRANWVNFSPMQNPDGKYRQH